MRPFETLESVTTSEGRTLSLHHRDGDYFIDLDGHELMSTRSPGSESELATLACRGLARVASCRVLIGGLGLGFTLRSALALLPRTAEVVVAEVFPCIVEWHARHLGHLGVSLDDERVRVHEGDVQELLGGSRGTLYDAIMLDVDNGPDAACLESNAGLYDDVGVALLAASLTPRGVVGVWSAHPDPAFEKRLRRGSFKVRVETVRSQGRKGNRHTIFLASKEAPVRTRSRSHKRGRR
jgi:spermidine synthase